MFSERQKEITREPSSACHVEMMLAPITQTTGCLHGVCDIGDISQHSRKDASPNMARGLQTTIYFGYTCLHSSSKECRALARSKYTTVFPLWSSRRSIGAACRRQCCIFGSEACFAFLRLSFNTKFGRHECNGLYLSLIHI